MPYRRRLIRHAIRVSVLAALSGCAVAAPASAAPTWLPAFNISGASSGEGTRSGDVAVDAAGNALVASAFDIGEFNQAEVRLRPAGGTFGDPQMLSEPGRDVNLVRLAMDGQGNAVAVWDELVSPSRLIRYAVRPAGGSFGAPQTLSAAGVSASEPEVAMAPDGTAVAVWLRGTTAQASVKPAGSSSFGPVSDLSAVGATQPRVAIDASGIAVANWIRHNGTTEVLEAAARAPGGAFVALAEVFNPGDAFDHLDNGNIAMDGSGRATLIFSHNDCPGAGCGDKHRIRSAARGTTGNFGPAAVISDPALDAGGAIFGQVVAVDPENTAVAVWSALDPISGTNRVQGAARASSASFGAVQNLSGPGGDIFDPTVGIGPNGQAVAVWSGLSGANPAVQGTVRPKGGSFGAVTDLDVGGEATGFASPAQPAFDAQGNALTAWRRSTASEYQIRGSAFDAAGPTLRSASIPSSGRAGVPVRFSVDPSDIWSSFSTVWSFGDGTSAAGATAQHVYATPGPYAVTVTATDAVGNSSSASQVIQIVAPPPVDADGDGSPSNKDCNDNNPGVRPGVIDVPNNGVDEDCAGGDALARLDTTITFSVHFFKRFTRITSLVAKNGVPAGATIRISCQGKRRGCPFRIKTIKRKKAAKTVSLTRYFKRTVRVGTRKRKRTISAKLPVGTRVEVRVTHPNAIGRYRTLTMRSSRLPRSQEGCLAATTSAKIGC